MPRHPDEVIDELRARWRERNICLQCRHHAMCKVAGAAPEMLIVVTQCLAFEPVGRKPTS